MRVELLQKPRSGNTNKTAIVNSQDMLNAAKNSSGLIKI